MNEKKPKKFEVQAISDEILEKLSLKNRYKYTNTKLFEFLEPNQSKFLKEAQKYCLRFEKKNNITHSPTEDIYDWMLTFGKNGYLTRAHEFPEIDITYEYYGLTANLILLLALTFFDPQFAMAAGATVLAINPLHWHHEDVEILLEILKKMVTGETPGAILITETARGSDAIHMLTICDEQEDESFTVDGTKIYNTNAPKSEYIVAYATGEKNNANMMAQFVVDTSWEGYRCERVNIPSVPKLFLGKETFNNVRIPKEYILGGIGKGRDYLFEGLVPERIGIAQMAVSQAWAALAHAGIYINNREQFGQMILKFQGVGFPFTDWKAKTKALTNGLLRFCEKYDEKMEKFGGELPSNISRALVSSASEYKYLATKLSERVCYEMSNLMGGPGFTDNTLMQDLLGISRIQEIVGGSRQIQQYIMSMAERQEYKLSAI